MPVGWTTTEAFAPLRWLIPAAAVLVSGALLLTASAAAQGPTRAAYIAEVDPICKETDRELRRVLRGYGDALDEHRHRRAARILRRGVRIFAESVRRVDRIQPPDQDRELIERWLDLERDDIQVTKKMARALRRDRIARYNRLVRRSRKLERRIDRLIGDYGFEHCN